MGKLYGNDYTYNRWTKEAIADTKKIDKQIEKIIHELMDKGYTIHEIETMMHQIINETILDIKLELQ